MARHPDDLPEHVWCVAIKNHTPVLFLDDFPIPSHVGFMLTKHNVVAADIAVWRTNPTIGTVWERADHLVTRVDYGDGVVLFGEAS